MLEMSFKKKLISSKEQALSALPGAFPQDSRTERTGRVGQTDQKEAAQW